MTVLAAPAPVIVKSSLMSRSPVAALFSTWPAIVSVYVPAGRIMVSWLGRAFASWIAARNVHSPAAVAHKPSPGLASRASAVLLTVKEASGGRTVVTRLRVLLHPLVSQA